MKKFLFALLLAPVFFSACKKDDTVSSEFIINGVHDVNLGTAGSNVLALGVAQTSGGQLPVTLSVTGLPTGVTSVIEPASGTPAFASTVTFSRDNSAITGTYPIHVVGKSVAYTKSYDLNLIVPKANYFTFSGTQYTADSVTRFESQGFSGLVAMNNQSQAGLQLFFSSNSLPSSGGTYKIVAFPSASNEVGLFVTYGTSFYSATGSDNKAATVTVTNNKIGVTFSNVEVRDATTGVGTTTASAVLAEY